MINNLTENLEYIKDENAFVYNVPLSNFLNLYFDDVPVDLSEVQDLSIVVSKYYFDNKLGMVKLDLGSYYEYFKLDNKGILTIDFYQQNKINDFAAQYDGMIGVIK